MSKPLNNRDGLERLRRDILNAQQLLALAIGNYLLDQVEALKEQNNKTNETH